MIPGPNRKVQSRTSTRAWATAVRPGGGVGVAADVLAEGDDGQDADDADQDESGFDDARRDEAECGGLADSAGDRVEREGGGDAGERGDELEDAPEEDLVVVACRRRGRSRRGR